MTKDILFIHGAGGEEAYEADGRLAESLRRELGQGFQVRYPKMPSAVEYQPWKEQIAKESSALAGPVALVGHSHGGSVLLKHLTEARSELPVGGVFLVAPPYWGAGGWEMEEFELPVNAASVLSRELPIHFYFARDDEIVPFSHLELYREQFPSATFHSVDYGGHQFSDDLALVARDLRDRLITQ